MTTINAVNNGLSGATGTGSFVGSNSPTLVTPALGTPASGVLTNMTGTQKGTTTNDNAAAGQVGEFISNVIAATSAVSLTSATATNVTSIPLTAGDWDVWGNIFFVYSVAGTVSSAWISSTSATQPDDSLLNQQITSVTQAGISAPSLRFSLSGATTVYLTAEGNFGSGTGTACGGIYARRAR